MLKLIIRKISEEKELREYLIITSLIIFYIATNYVGYRLYGEQWAPYLIFP